jgi:hypothetical protein
LEDQLLQKIIYDSDKMVPIDITITSTIDTRNKLPSFQKHYDKWRIAPGQKKSMIEEAAIVEADRIELRNKQYNDKHLEQVQAAKKRQKDDDKESKKKQEKKLKEKKRQKN